MKKQFNLYAKYGSDSKKEIEGVPFVLDEETNTHIIIARWCNRNIEHQKAQAELTTKIAKLPEQEQEIARLEVFVNHLVMGWNNITDQQGNIIEFSKKSAFELLKQLPDLVGLLIEFSLNRENYPLDNLELIEKN